MTDGPVPNAPIDHRPDAAPLRARLERAGWSLTEAALLVGVTSRTLQRYFAAGAAARGHVIPYPLQFTLEALARHPRPAPRRARKARPKKQAAPAPAQKPTTAPTGMSRLLGRSR